MYEFEILAGICVFVLGIGFGLVWGHAMGVRDTMQPRRFTFTRRNR